MLKIVTISDTHGFTNILKIPHGDMLVHAGDATERGTRLELIEFNSWLATLPHKYKIFVPGNHDFLFESDERSAREIVSAAFVLLDSSITIDGIKFYGSSWQPQFHNWAFNLQRGKALADKWAKIPSDTDVLITHSPPFGRGDRTLAGENIGCDDLLKAVKRVKPKLHIFGHIHEDHGVSRNNDTIFINTSICNRDYIPVNAPITLNF